MKERSSEQSLAEEISADERRPCANQVDNKKTSRKAARKLAGLVLSIGAEAYRGKCVSEKAPGALHGLAAQALFRIVLPTFW